MLDAWTTSDRHLSTQDRRFRDTLRTFFREEVPQDIRRKVSVGQQLSKADIVTSQRILNAQGLAVPHWPQEWGGCDWSPLQHYLFLEELLVNAVPLPLQFNCYMIGPLLATFGTQAQKTRFLARAAKADDWWCQGFSEPGAGSDLASVTTRAVRQGDAYVVDGQKTWTTYAQYADWMFCLVRTARSERKQQGISFLVVDMTSPGIEVRPIISMDGRHEVNEVFLTDVRVPLENLVGEENRGWEYAKHLLSGERAGIARIGLSKERVQRIRRRARENGVWDDPVFRAEVVRLEVELKALEMTQLTILRRQADAPGRPDPASSILKLRGSELQQRAAALLMEVEGEGALRSTGDVTDSSCGPLEELAAAAAMNNYLNFRKVSIYGGSNEIQRNIIAKTILEL